MDGRELDSEAVGEFEDGDDGVCEKAEKFGEEHAENAGDEAFDDGFGAEDADNVAFTGADGAKDADFFSALENGDIGDDADHDA